MASVSPTKRVQLVCINVGGGLELHGRGRHLPGALVTHPEHGAVDHSRMPEQDGFDLRGCHLEPADLDHLLAAVGEVDPPVGLEEADIARAVPPVVEGVRRRLVGQVARHGGRAADLDLARLTRPQDGTRIKVHHPQRDIADRQAGRVQPPGSGVVDRVGRDDRHLARPVGRQPTDARARGHGLGDPAVTGVAPHMT